MPLPASVEGNVREIAIVSSDATISVRAMFPRVPPRHLIDEELPSAERASRGAVREVVSMILSAKDLDPVALWMSEKDKTVGTK